MARPSQADARRSGDDLRATRALAARGFERLRLADVASEAGVSVGTVQHYFRSREALVAATFRHFNDDAVARWTAVADTAIDPWGRLEALTGYVATRLLRWDVWTEVAAAAMRDDVLRASYEEAYRLWRAPIATAVAEGVERGAFTPVRPVADVVDGFLALVDGLGLQAQLGLVSRERLHELLLSRLADDLGVPGRAALRSVG